MTQVSCFFSCSPKEQSTQEQDGLFRRYERGACKKERRAISLLQIGKGSIQTLQKVIFTLHVKVFWSRTTILN
jgi:hypothetical protein